MAILGTLLKKGIRLRESLEQEYSAPLELQKKTLQKLLIKAAKTEIGKKYEFDQILKSFKKGDHDFYAHFSKQIAWLNFLQNQNPKG